MLRKKRGFDLSINPLIINISQMKASNTILMHHMFQHQMKCIVYEVCRYEKTYISLLCMPKHNYVMSFEYYIVVYHQGCGIMDSNPREGIDG
jgi:hypothetical protein